MPSWWIDAECACSLMLTSLSSFFDGISSLIWFTSPELKDHSLTVFMGKSSTSLFIHDKPLIHWELLFISSSVVPCLVPRSETLLDVCIYCHWSEFLKRFRLFVAYPLFYWKIFIAHPVQNYLLICELESIPMMPSKCSSNYFSCIGID